MKSLLFVLLGLLTSTAFALPRAPFNALEVSVPKSRNLLRQQLNYDFEGIVKLSNCSGSLVQLSGQPDTALGLVMTNGHCIQKPGGYLNPDEVWLNREISREMKLFDGQMKLHPIRATKIVYATMTDTDVAFYELTETYAQIEARTGVRPLLLDTAHPVQGQAIEIISGYWDRGWTCNIHSFIYRMKEGAWSWTDSIRYTETCDTMGGTSGSPIIAKGTRTAIAVNNTSNESGQVCTLNNPCEVDENGNVAAYYGVRYGQQTFNLYSCLTPDFRIDLTLEGCALPKVQE